MLLQLLLAVSDSVKTTQICEVLVH